MLNAYDVSAKWVCFSPFVSLVFLCWLFLFFFFSSKKESDGGGRRLEKPAGKCSPAAAVLEQKRAELCVTIRALCTVCGQGLWPRGPQGSRGIPQRAHLLRSPWLHYSWIWGNFMEKAFSIHVDRCLGWAQWGARARTRNRVRPWAAGTASLAASSGSTGLPNGKTFPLFFSLKEILFSQEQDKLSLGSAFSFASQQEYSF